MGPGNHLSGRRDLARRPRQKLDLLDAQGAGGLGLVTFPGADEGLGLLSRGEQFDGLFKEGTHDALEEQSLRRRSLSTAARGTASAYRLRRRDRYPCHRHRKRDRWRFHHGH
jgi:hypothetical protein